MNSIYFNQSEFNATEFWLRKISQVWRQFNQSEFNATEFWLRIIIHLKNRTIKRVSIFIRILFSISLIATTKLSSIFIKIIFSIKVSLKTIFNASFWRLAWVRQMNPDIIGYNIYIADNPYNNYTLIKTTNKLVYLFGLIATTKKWLKVVPYTSRGELSPIIIKAIRG